MPDPSCPECRGSGLDRSGVFCEVCQIKPRPAEVAWLTDQIQERVSRSFPGFTDGFGAPPSVRAELERMLEANRRAREAALYPPEWLFKVWAVVDHPAGSGASWSPEKRIVPGKNAIGVQIDIIAPSPDVARAFVADALRDAGHSKWLVTKIQRRDKETETAREIVREALERARLGT